MKRFLCFLLTIIMMLTVPVAVYAEDVIANKQEEIFLEDDTVCDEDGNPVNGIYEGKYYINGVFEKYTGVYKSGEKSYYFVNGKAQSGKQFVNSKYRYYSPETYELLRNETVQIGKYIYEVNRYGILKNTGLIYIQQTTPENELLPYPSSELPKATIASGGCGVCTSLMVIKNQTANDIDLKSWSELMMKTGCRVNGGTDINKTAKLMKNMYGFKMKKTRSLKKLKKHLKKGYMAICNVGLKGYFAQGGHYVVAAGIDKKGRVIILDPYMTPTKYQSVCRGINRKKYFKYSKKTNEVRCKFKTLNADSKGEKFYLFTPVNDIAIRKSKQSEIVL